MLPVIQPDARAGRLERALGERVRGEVRFDTKSRLLYSTDASLYQILPVGVVLPRDVEDVQAALTGDAVGQRLPAVVIRGGQRTELSIEIGERP